ncbi:hypothetical protein E2C01_016295 [Portunus trituberculatus]|uniref:Uncharacterized protein n=1 Tax=Portunus trituberculatus TaxID=210409 RepID=A0A5B7DPW5_PORTR|nr:hypothetical protein [Portunus trituberculatus]
MTTTTNHNNNNHCCHHHYHRHHRHHHHHYLYRARCFPTQLKDLKFEPSHLLLHLPVPFLQHISPALGRKRRRKRREAKNTQRMQRRVCNRWLWLALMGVEVWGVPVGLGGGEEVGSRWDVTFLSCSSTLTTFFSRSSHSNWDKEGVAMVHIMKTQ